MALTAAACQSQDDPAGLRVVVAQRPSSVDGEAVWLQTPTGRVAVTFGGPVAALTGAAGGEVEAGAGEVFVPFVVEDRPREGVPAEAARLLDGYDLAPEVSVAAGEASLELGAASGVTAATTLPLEPQWLAVPEEDAEDLAIGVEVDGLTQRVGADGERETGAAAALYEPAPVDEEACDEGWQVRGEPRARLSVSCSAVAFTYPYAPGRGWAADGETWGFLLLDSEVLRLALGPGVTAEQCRSLSTEDVDLTASRPVPRAESARAGTPPVAGFDVTVPGGQGLGFARAGSVGGDSASAWPRITAEVRTRCEVASGARPLTLTRSFTLDPT